MPPLPTDWKASRYDVAILPQLEANIDAQCAGSQSYDLEANLAALKLYQFHPETLKVATVAKVLIKALMNLPETDYLACTYLVPERVLDEEPVKSITTIASDFEGCRFREVWAKLREEALAEVLAATKGFEAAMRTFVLHNFEITYQSVPTAHVSASLGFSDVDGGSVKELLSGRGWTIEGDLVKIALNDDNTAKPKRVDASGPMDFAQMTKILSSVQMSARAA